MCYYSSSRKYSNKIGDEQIILFRLFLQFPIRIHCSVLAYWDVAGCDCFAGVVGAILDVDFVADGVVVDV